MFSVLVKNFEYFNRREQVNKTHCCDRVHRTHCVQSRSCPLPFSMSRSVVSYFKNTELTLILQTSKPTHTYTKIERYLYISYYMNVCMYAYPQKNNYHLIFPAVVCHSLYGTEAVQM